MTEDRLALVELIDQGANDELVREMLAFAAGRIMELDVEARTGLGHKGPDGSNATSRRCARAPISRRSSSRAARPRRSSRKPASKPSPHAPSMT
jgi:hypothetical protein